MGEILFLALLTAFIAYKLFSILGQTTDEDTDRRQNKMGSCTNGACGPNWSGDANNARNDSRNSNNATIKIINAELISDKEHTLKPEIIEKLNIIRQLDTKFDLDAFLSGAERAFKIITKAITNEDDDTLKNLIEKPLYNKVITKINENKTKDIVIYKEIKEIHNIDIADININGKLITISLLIQSDQKAYSKDTKNNLLNGNETMFVKNIDKWTFIRHMAMDNIWKLSSM